MQHICPKFIFISLMIFHKCSSDPDKLINEFVVKIPGGYSEAFSVAIQMGFILKHKMIGFDDLFVFKHKTSGDNIHKFYRHRLKRSNKVHSIDQQVAKKRVKRASLPANKSPLFNDPMYHRQWYLMRSSNNPQQFDMNVLEAWKLGFTGKGVVVSILDDGIDYRHPDLKDNYDKRASYDLNGGDHDPLPNFRYIDNRHGTRCAGEVAAKGNNNNCGVGVAFNAGIGAVRMLDGEVTDRVEAEALGLQQQYIHIYSGSWGPDDNGQKVDGPAKFAKASFEKGVKQGRNGLGNIYVWASGNGGKNDDSCSCDGYASSMYTLSVSSVSEKNRRPWYLESCTSTLISTYSSGGADEGLIITTDLNGNCAMDHTGTSASAPIAAGIIALLLEANPQLTWRDVQYITVVTANTQPFAESDFLINAANRKVSDLYGFGLMDAGKMVRLGRLWETLPPQHVCKNGTKAINRNLYGIFTEIIPLEMTGCSGPNVVNYVEHVILRVTVEYQRRGDLEITLISPSGTKSLILPRRNHDSYSGSATFDKWPLMSVQFWGESSVGKWILMIRNNQVETNMTGILRSFSLEIYGTEKFPMRLRAPPTIDNDNWFEQFERFVVSNSTKHIPDKEEHYKSLIVTNDSTSVGNIAECHGQCYNNSCNGWGPQHCKSCKNYQNFNGVCVKECPPGTYSNHANLTCISCHFSCDKCMGPGKYNCSRCHVGDIFVNGTNQCKMSLKECPVGFFKDHSKCTKCRNDCPICTSSTRCSLCKGDLVLTLSYQCKPTCDLGSYPDSGGRCRACHIDCLSCIDGSPNGCTSCSTESYKLSIYDNYNFGKCVSDCQPTHFTNASAGQCYRCSQDCRRCTGPSPIDCTDCIPPMSWSNSLNLCIDPASYNCEPGEYKGPGGQCQKCPSNCKTCADGQCTRCSLLNKFVYNNTCVEKCPKDHFFLSEYSVCLKCESFCDPSNPRESLPSCKQCSQDSKVNETHCNKSEHWDVKSGSCKTCNSVCSGCKGSGPHDCIKCSQPHYLVSGYKCALGCPVGEYSHVSDNRNICIPCHLSCKNSLCNTENGRCEECPVGHQLSNQGRCERIITCQMSSYWGANETCTSCDKSCRSCSNSNQCSSCLKDSCLHPSFGSCHPCCSPFWSNVNCLKCKAGNEFCDIFESPARVSRSAIFGYSVVSVCCGLLLMAALFALARALLYLGEILSALRQRQRHAHKYARLTDEDESSDCNSDPLIVHNGPYLLLPSSGRESFVLGDTGGSGTSHKGNGDICTVGRTLL